MASICSCCSSFPMRRPEAMPNPPTIAFVTFGCRLNRAEALDFEARARAEGCRVVDLDSGIVPDRIVVRGCSVTAKAQRDCEKTIGRLRQRFPLTDIRITGCLPQAVALGTVPTATGAATGPVPMTTQGTVPTATDTATGPVPMTTSRAYLKIQDGCSGKCAFCIVPAFRGPPRSVPFGDVLARARAFLAAGYRELVVTGCNLALYQSEGQTLPALLAALARLESTPAATGTVPRHRVRLGSLEPGIHGRAIIDAMVAHPNICRFLHLSLQSGSDAVLERMNRPYSISRVADFCAEAAARLGPRLCLGADVIAGFPGETETDHLLTRRFLFQSAPFAFAKLHVFPYSERPGTPAATMTGALPRAVRMARAKELERLGQARRAAFARSFIGQTVDVCVERGGDHGWTAEYLPCRLATPAPRRSLVAVAVRDVDAGGNLLA
ncbi:MAG: radical SAM protein [Kiritimatiellia bacterium]